MYINIVSHHFVQQNLITVSEWFQLGMIAQWKDSQETKQRKLYKQYEQQAIEYASNIAYENGIVLS
jgi:hypothetical protein